ncbi:MAG: CorA family divalent cation transporter [Lachnospiraceae bacterium]
MRILTLGATLEEFEGNENVNTEEVINPAGLLVISGSDEATKALETAEIQFEGDTGLKNIEFSKVEAQQECLAGSLRIPRLSDVCSSKFKILFFVNYRNIVIIDDSGFTEKLITRIQIKRKSQGQTRERFIYNFITGIMERDLEFLGKYERQIMKLEDDVLNGKYEDYLQMTAQIRKELLVLREYYDEMHDLGKELEENENKFFAKKNLKYFGIVADRAERLKNRTTHLLDYIGQVKDSYQQKVTEEQNKNMEFLTIISTIFFPLTLITGWYGMNFENMPELAQGYPFVIVLSIMVVVVIIIVFKKRKLL